MTKTPAGRCRCCPGGRPGTGVQRIRGLRRLLSRETTLANRSAPQNDAGCADVFVGASIFDTWTTAVAMRTSAASCDRVDDCARSWTSLSVELLGLGTMESSNGQRVCSQ
jgi:hypothetical protein